MRLYFDLINAVLREAYPKDIRFFYTNTERYLAAGTQSVGKRSGATLRARFAGGKALQIIKKIDFL